MYVAVVVESRCVDIVVLILLTTTIFPVSVNLCNWLLAARRRFLRELDLGWL